MTPRARAERLHKNDRPDDQRVAFQRDRDRILYTSAFRRLGSITQVVSSAEGALFHNRLTHTLEVAQIGRRLAEKLLDEQCETANLWGGIDPDVVEAAALAHDLGHPPFGHTTETELDELIRNSAVADGFEGNAQSFRVVTKLAVRHGNFVGLNLTRATLNAILKYPWHRAIMPRQRFRKWGAYSTESDEFIWAREGIDQPDQKTVEAELMDFADDVAYAVHDLDDFYRAGLIPLDTLSQDPSSVQEFLDSAFESLERREIPPSHELDECRRYAERLMQLMPSTRYTGTDRQRAHVRSMTSGLISRYISGIELQEPGNGSGRPVSIRHDISVELFVLRQLTWHFVIDDASLSTQQYGQRQMIRKLYDVFADSAESKNIDMFPKGYQERLIPLVGDGSLSARQDRIRIVADFISGLTEQQATDLYQRIAGVSLGTVMNPIVT